jgi:hypothetical protein
VPARRAEPARRRYGLPRRPPWRVALRDAWS